MSSGCPLCLNLSLSLVIFLSVSLSTSLNICLLFFLLNRSQVQHWLQSNRIRNTFAWLCQRQWKSSLCRRLHKISDFQDLHLQHCGQFHQHLRTKNSRARFDSFFVERCLANGVHILANFELLLVLLLCWWNWTAIFLPNAVRRQLFA